MKPLLHESARATAGADGRAIATLQPLRSFENWQINHITVSSDSVTLKPTAKIYRGVESPHTLENGTYSGSFDVDRAADMQLLTGQTLLCVWEGCDVGATCVVSVSGEILRKG